jgi:hypothetical protein
VAIDSPLLGAYEGHVLWRGFFTLKYGENERITKEIAEFLRNIMILIDIEYS